MKNINTIDDLFATAIDAEATVKCFYSRLANLFVHLPEVSRLWKMMMDDEDFHARELKDIKGRLTAEQLNKAAVPQIAALMDAAMEDLTGKLDINNIKTLDDAVETAYELEFSEINTVFHAITKEYASSETRANFVLSMVREHVSRLEELSKVLLPKTKNRKVPALNNGKAGS